MHVRLKRGRAIVASPSTGQAHGRPLPTAPATRRRSPDSRDARVRLVEALVLTRMQAAKVETHIHPRALKARLDRARKELGPDASKRITVAFAETTGAMLSTVKKAHVEARPHAVRAAIRFVLLLDEHDVRSTAALGLLASSAQWSALSDLLRDLAFAVDPSALSVTQSKTKDDTSVTAHLPMLGDLLKLGTTASQAARLDLLTALQIEREARDGEREAPMLPPRAGSDPRDGWTPGMRAAIDRRERQTAEGAAIDVEAPTHAPPSDDAPAPDVEAAMDNPEPARRTRVDDAPDERPVRVADRVVSAVETERQERAATHVGRVLVADGVIAPAGSGDDLAPPAPARAKGICPHGLGELACPTCWKAREEARLAENRARIRRDQQ